MWKFRFLGLLNGFDKHAVIIEAWKVLSVAAGYILYGFIILYYALKEMLLNCVLSQIYNIFDFNLRNLLSNVFLDMISFKSLKL